MKLLTNINKQNKWLIHNISGWVHFVGYHAATKFSSKTTSFSAKLPTLCGFFNEVTLASQNNNLTHHPLGYPDPVTNNENIIIASL